MPQYNDSAADSDWCLDNLSHSQSRSELYLFSWWYVIFCSNYIVKWIYSAYIPCIWLHNFLNMHTTKQEMQVLNFLLIHPQHFITDPWVCLSHGNHTDSVFCHHQWQHHSRVESPPFLISTLWHQWVLMVYHCIQALNQSVCLGLVAQYQK